MKTTITVENEGTEPISFRLDQGIYQSQIAHHYLEPGMSITLTTSAWPLKVHQEGTWFIK